MTPDQGTGGAQEIRKATIALSAAVADSPRDGEGQRPRVAVELGRCAETRQSSGQRWSKLKRKKTRRARDALLASTRDEESFPTRLTRSGIAAYCALCTSATERHGRHPRCALSPPLRATLRTSRLGPLSQQNPVLVCRGRTLALFKLAMRARRNRTSANEASEGNESVGWYYGTRGKKKGSARRRRRGQAADSRRVDGKPCVGRKADTERRKPRARNDKSVGERKNEFGVPGGSSLTVADPCHRS